MGRQAWAVGWAPLAVIVAHTLLSVAFGHQRSLDPLFHFLGGVAGALALWRGFDALPALARRVGRRHRPVAVLLVMVCVTLCWELIEFLSDRFRGTHIQQGALDTWSDVTLGVAGAVVFLFLVVTSRSRPRPSEPAAS